jgi:LuxR family transcriptional regulator, maltose regulon positive regulatory protein
MSSSGSTALSRHVERATRLAAKTVETTDSTVQPETPIGAGWEALRRMDWARARACFQAAADSEPSAEALEGLGLAAWWLGDAATVFVARERAYTLYQGRGEHVAAARLATLLGIDYYQLRGDAAIGNGWFQRAHRLLDGMPAAPEHGWLWIWEGQMALVAGNDPAAARMAGGKARELGRSLGLVDIEMTGLGLEGVALVFEGEVAAGMTRLDEATTAAVAGEMSVPNAIGATCCYMLFACERVWDFDRAVQWCRKLQEFCRQTQWASLFARCRTHHAMILLWQGAWPEAEAELLAGAKELQATGPGSLPQASIRLAELRRRQGRLDEAESLLEHIPFLPHAMLCLASVAADRDRPLQALDLLDRFLRQVPRENRTDRALALDLAVRAHAALGQLTQASDCLAELETLATRVSTAPLRASAALAHGRLASVRGEQGAARRHVEDALDLFQAAGTPFETAEARLELAGVLMAMGEQEPAARGAREAYEKCSAMGAGLLARRADALLAKLRSTAGARGREPTFGLTTRELEVLRLVARGSSNPQIAAALVLSEHTVRRHVANILTKLDVPSRAAAAAVAARHGLL